MGDPKGFLKHPRNAPKLLPVEERLKHHEEHYEVFTGEQVRQQASRCMDCGVPFCMTGCPLGNLIPEWNDFAYRGLWEEAIKALHATNNFPEFTGRICPAPCENSCVLGIIEPAVTIKLHEMSVIDEAFARGWIKPQAPLFRSGKKVAIVGGGPAGLAAAQQLNRAGHLVTVFEKSDRAGGLVMYGIPHYKLRKEKVQRRLDILAAEGIQIRLLTEVGKDVSVESLQKDFDAIVLATGAEEPRDLSIPGRELSGIHFAMEFLPQQNRINWGDADPALLHPKKQRIDAKGKKVIVIGGGDTGSDCIGTSIRQGAASVLNLELLPEPPANRAKNNPWPQYARIKRLSSSVDEMQTRGGQVLYSVSSVRFIGENGVVKALETVKLDWSKGKPEPISGTEQRHDCDLALLAMGFLGPRQGLLKQFGVALDQRGNIVTDPKTHATNVQKVFAAGDCRRGQSLVVWAIAEGREIARAVDEYLMKKPSLLPSVKITPFNY